MIKTVRSLPLTPNRYSINRTLLDQTMTKAD